MGGRIVARTSAIIALALLGLALSTTNAPALFTGVDIERDAEEAAASGDAEAARGADADTRAATAEAQPTRHAVDPFDDTAGLTLPEEMPEAVVRRSQARYNRPTNAKRFEYLLGRTQPTKERTAATEPEGPAAPPKASGSRAADYVIGVLVIAGLGATFLLLFRRHH